MSQKNAPQGPVQQIKVRITTTGDPTCPYELRWKKGLLQWPGPPVATKRGCNIDLQFHLKDSANTGVQFATPVCAAFGASTNTRECPPPGSDAGGEIDFTQSSSSAQALTIRDRNVTAGDINFAVYFSNGTKLDPIIKNSGGGTPGFS